MTVVIVHYHLRAGGVSRVIERQIEALRRFSVPSLRIFLLTASEPQFNLSENVTPVIDHNVDYFSVSDKTLSEINNKEQAILSSFASFPKDAVFHIHNPTLGKSLPLTAALHKLASEGYRLFYHCHDFAEERPLMMKQVVAYCRAKGIENYTKLLYPQVKTVTYLLANREDMLRSVLSSRNCEYLPNPVIFTKDCSLSKDEVACLLDIASDKEWILYPVRAITRKNIGELILLSLLFGEGYEWLVTLAPENPDELPLYEQWLSISTELEVPVHYNVATQVSVESLMCYADAVITTSYKEGFGMAFLESWLVDTPVYGRRINQVVTDFEGKGILFHGLYDSLMVPVEGEQWVDFTTLSLEQQITLVRKLKEGVVYSGDIFEENAYLIHLFDSYSQEDIIHNKAVVKNSYSLSAFAKKLLSLYEG